MKKFPIFGKNGIFDASTATVGGGGAKKSIFDTKKIIFDAEKSIFDASAATGGGP